MISRSVALGLVAAGCMTAAAGGAYVAVRQNSSAPSVQQSPIQHDAAASGSVQPQAKPVAETEAVVSPSASPDVAAPEKSTDEPRATAREATAPRTVRKPDVGARVDRAPARAQASSRPAPAAPPREPARTEIPVADPAVGERAPAARENASAPVSAPPATVPETPVADPTPAPAKPSVVEVTVPIASVVGLRVDTAISSETARVEDRVEARVTRDVIADGRVAIPAGTRAIGDVVLVERGGKMKDKARLGVRFHTLVLANGNQMPLRTDAIYREGTSPGAESARKIGGAAVGGAILGAIIGGAKGAAIGGATGAAGGSAVVMAGDRNAATLPAGTVLSVRLNSPIAIDIEREH